mmetsp:Transcript_1109/g.3445  ORF Transcript_1109/g.3445 Transcript_1109/m.3445 type:complete len:201 (-) Transcript_1109:434-1036(-)
MSALKIVHMQESVRSARHNSRVFFADDCRRYSTSVAAVSASQSSSSDIICQNIPFTVTNNYALAVVCNTYAGDLTSSAIALLLNRRERLYGSALTRSRIVNSKISKGCPGTYNSRIVFRDEGSSAIVHRLSQTEIVCFNVSGAKYRLLSSNIPKFYLMFLATHYNNGLRIRESHEAHIVPNLKEFSRNSSVVDLVQLSVG